jgi:hypothetical protein
MNPRQLLGAFGILMLALSMPAAVTAQGQGGNDSLRRDIERRFEVLPLRGDALALRPKSDMSGIRSIELTDGTIAIDGDPVTGGELREKLGSAADAVIRLSYLDPAARRVLLGLAGSSSPQTPEAPQTTPPSPPPLPPSGPLSPRPRRGRHGGDRVRFGGTVTVREDEIVQGDVVAIGGSVDIDGEVTGDVVAVGGSVELGPHAIAGKDVVVVGGSFRRAEGARIDGKLSEISGGNFDFSGLRWGRIPFGAPWSSWGLGSTFRLASTITRLLVLSLLVSVVILLAHDYVERVAARARAEPLKAGLVGFLAQVLFLPVLLVTIVALVITVVGIPLLALIPFALLAMAIVFLVGFAAVAYDVGRFVASRVGWATDNRYACAIVGIIAVVSPVLVGRLFGIVFGFLFPLTLLLGALGFACEYVAWTVGFGAVALLRFDKTGQPAPVSPG